MGGFRSPSCDSDTFSTLLASKHGVGHDADARIVSRNKPATASSSAGSQFIPEKAGDNNSATRWTSPAGDDQWIKVDLQARYRIDRIMLYWDAGYGREYQIQVSEDGTAWTTLYLKVDGTGGSDNLALNGTGRYVRMKGIMRGTSGGYSLKEFDVYGEPVGFVRQGGCLGATPVTRNQNPVGPIGARLRARYPNRESIPGRKRTRYDR